MADHDQRFKTLLREFFGQFFELFFPDWARQFDFSRVEWLDKEVFPDPPVGLRRSLDLVAKLPVNEPQPDAAQEVGREWLALVHVEVESADTVAPLRRRMYQYYNHLRGRHDLPVLPVAVYLNVGLKGVGRDRYEEHFGQFEVVRFNYLYVGLPKLSAVEYVESPQPLGVAPALMKTPRRRRPRLKAEALQRLAGCGENEYRKFLLAECVQAYLPLDEPREQREFEQLLKTSEYREVQVMATTWFEQGIQEGRQQGRQEERRAILAVLLEERFGPLSASVRQKLENWPADRVGELIRKVLTANSLDELGLDD